MSAVLPAFFRLHFLQLVMALPHSWTQDELLGLTLLPRVKATAIRHAVERYESLSAMLDDAPPDFEHVGIIRGSLFPSRVRESILALADEQHSLCQMRGVRLVSFWDEDYPMLLRHIYYPPVMLYVRGYLQTSQAAAIGIVGTRHCTDYGERVTQRYASEFASQGIVVVSGLAAGIDSIAHRATLEAGGITYAVVASGVDRASTASAARAVEEISERGAVISEYPCGTAAAIPHFPQRNRIISGIAKAVIVIESGEKGGSLITAKFAFDQNRDVFAVPGLITSERSRGTNLLIQRSQACLTLEPDDVLYALGWKTAPPTRAQRSRRAVRTGEDHEPKTLDSTDKMPEQAPPAPALRAAFMSELTQSEQVVMECLSAEPIHIDTLAQRTSMPIGELLVVMLELEFKNAVRQLPGKHFVSVLP